MRTFRRAIAATLVLAAWPAAAQLSNHGVALEAGATVPAGASGGAAAGVALTASSWIEGDLEGVARVAFSAADETEGRGAAPSVSGTVGLRLSLLPDPVRPELQVEIGWARVVSRGSTDDRLALGMGGGLEWFPARDASLAVRLAVRGSPAHLRVEAAVAAAVYF